MGGGWWAVSGEWQVVIGRRLWVGAWVRLVRLGQSGQSGQGELDLWWVVFWGGSRLRW